MKSVWMGLMLMFLAEALWAQKKPDLPQSSKNKPSAKAPALRMDSAVVLQNTTGYRALGSPATSLKIYDGTVNALNQRAAGLEINVGSSGIVGMPKVYYGIANGKLLLRNTTALVTGSSTGSGSVGTGTHIGTAGAAGNSIGVNGKSPDAGPSIYGTRPYGSLLLIPGSTSTGSNAFLGKKVY